MVGPTIPRLHCQVEELQWRRKGCSRLVVVLLSFVSEVLLNRITCIPTNVSSIHTFSKVHCGGLNGIYQWCCRLEWTKQLLFHWWLLKMGRMCKTPPPLGWVFGLFFLGNCRNQIPIFRWLNSDENRIINILFHSMDLQSQDSWHAGQYRSNLMSFHCIFVQVFYQ